ncbi:MAG: peptidylprolyl isomerase [Rhodanobacter sp.]|nr:MAG: peptidylprolyl isomerase [Rhodanobacter sp.]TAM05792.1 MAG: peptidylprolyl isomerase [Rhodanobacter sp.]TAM41563.1 MAG: peptidylprolyl isomerase [Rhodanobacter sp.]TAN28330.1 MAG: peptidylprolyl isomerase [Rhodanobacter sp.]
MKVNNVSIDASQWPTAQVAAVRELLRQRARELGLLADNADAEATAAAIEQLLEDEVEVPEPTTEECRRWYDTHRARYRNGELIHARHILFQVTPGTPVAAVRSVAEAMLMELRANPDLFAERARSKSNCPSCAQGGQLGQLARGSTVPEFEKAVFEGDTIGILPQLVHSRHGLHIVAVDQRIPGEQLPFEAMAGKVADELRAASEQRALGQYVRVLAGRAELDGVDLNAAASPLVQ